MNSGVLSEQLLTAARSYIGTPFRHQGRLPGLGLDCAGLVVAAVKECGLNCDDVAGYGRSPYRGLLEKTLQAQKILQPIADPELGAILLFKIRHDPQHLALCAGETIVHSYETIGRVVEERLTPFWLDRLVACYRVRYE